jgi:TPP-dependent pyruvate/acetoin dehydrogenase alpha subunit
LPVVANNGWGISTPAGTQQAARSAVERGKAFGIPGRLIDGNDPVACWHALAAALDHCRRMRSLYLLEARVARLYGHFSSSGGVQVDGEPARFASLFRSDLRAGALRFWCGVR